MYERINKLVGIRFNVFTWHAGDTIESAFRLALAQGCDIDAAESIAVRVVERALKYARCEGRAFTRARFPILTRSDSLPVRNSKLSHRDVFPFESCAEA